MPHAIRVVGEPTVFECLSSEHWALLAAKISGELASSVRLISCSEFAGLQAHIFGSLSRLDLMGRTPRGVTDVSCGVGILWRAAPYWAQELMRMGHDVRLIPPVYVKPLVKPKKNDAAEDVVKPRRALFVQATMLFNGRMSWLTTRSDLKSPRNRTKMSSAVIRLAFTNSHSIWRHKNVADAIRWFKTACVADAERTSLAKVLTIQFR